MACFIELDGQPGEDARELAERCADLPVPLPTDWVSVANRYVCPVGFSPGRGSILMTRSRLDKISLRKQLTLRMGDGFGQVREFPAMRVVGNPRCISSGTADPVFLVGLADWRIDLLSPTVQRYNWRWSPTDPDPAFGTDSFTTLAEVAQSLWESLPSLGDWPGLPAEVPTPTADVIDHLDGHGFRTVDFLEDVLAAMGCGLSFDPTNPATTKQICYFPAGQDRALDVMQRLRGSLNYDESPYVPADGGPIPAQVGVIFPVWPADRVQHLPRRVYIVAVSRPTGANWAGGTTMSDSVAYLMDFVPCRVDQRFNPQNTTQLANRAAQVARIWYDRFLDTSPQWPLMRTYKMIQDDPDLIPGASFDVVGWSVGAEGPVTFVVRSALTAVTDLYDGPALEGIRTNFDPTAATDPDGVPSRTGGQPPEVDREQAAWGWGQAEIGSQSAIRTAGAGLGPLYRRGTALRQGEWVSIGTGGRTDQRGRLWRSWEQVGPDDMVRFVKVVGALDTGRGNRYRCRVMQQVGDPAVWPEEEFAWAREPNDQALELNRLYLARAAIDLFEGKLTWDTICCPPTGEGYPEPEPTCCPDLDQTINVLVSSSSGSCPACLPLTLTLTYSSTTGRWCGSAQCVVGGCTYTYTACLQCYPCSNPPLDPICEDPDCSTEDYYYCYSWTLHGSGSGCQPDTSGTISIAGTDFPCNGAATFDHDLLGCTVSVQVGNPGISTDCCATDPTPFHLTATLVGSNGCEMFDGAYDLTFDHFGGSPDWVWLGAVNTPGCGPNWPLFFSCNVTTWGGVFAPGIPTFDNYAVLSVQCNPFVVVIQMDTVNAGAAACFCGGNPAGTIIMTITG